MNRRHNISTSPTFERQKRLEREGFIKGYKAVLDSRRMGQGIMVICNMRLKRHSQLLMDEFMGAVRMESRWNNIMLYSSFRAIKLCVEHLY